MNQFFESLYNSNGVIEKEPELWEGEWAICEVTHDESTFYANNWQKQGYWHLGEAKAPMQKEDGPSIMVADFLMPETGRLMDGIG